MTIAAEPDISWIGRVTAPFRNWSTSQAAYPLGYSAGLDGVRGIMTLAVLGAHTRGLLFPGAVVFMDSFFAMSGYLITSILLKDYSKTGRIDFRKFYIRRFLRLFPALATMLIVLLLVAAVFSADFKMRLLDAAVSFFYISNYWRAFDGPGLWYTVHTWSLSVEEQFYVLWPITLLLLLRWIKVSWRTVAVILIAALGFALWRAWLTYSGASINRLYNAFDTRADALLIGCALAITLRLVDLDKYPRWSLVLSWSLVPLSIFGLIIALKVDHHMRWYYYIAPLLGAIPACIFTAGLLQKRRNVMHAVYEHPVPVFCGRICYGLYIWHYPIFSLMREHNFAYITIFLIGWPIAFGLATASYYLIERHFMRVRPV